MDKPPYEVIQIDEKSWRICEKGVMSFLFVGAEKALLIDSGFGTGNIKEVVESLTKLPIMLVTTHADRDHVGGNKQFDKAYMHPAEFHRYRTHTAVEREFPAEPLWENDIIDLGGRCFKVVLIPGHTPGNIVLLDAENRILTGSDSIQAEKEIWMFGPGRDMDAYIHSMKKLRDMRDCFSAVYPSHGPFPVDPGVIDDLITGAELLRDGKIEGGPPPGDAPPQAAQSKLYAYGRVKFLY